MLRWTSRCCRSTSRTRTMARRAHELQFELCWDLPRAQGPRRNQAPGRLVVGGVVGLDGEMCRWWRGHFSGSYLSPMGRVSSHRKALLGATHAIGSDKRREVAVDTAVSGRPIRARTILIRKQSVSSCRCQHPTAWQPRPQMRNSTAHCQYSTSMSSPRPHDAVRGRPYSCPLRSAEDVAAQQTYPNFKKPQTRHMPNHQWRPFAAP